MNLTQLVSRRDALRLIGGGAITLATVPVLAPRAADAATSWCRIDPGVVINGIRLQVYPERDSGQANTCTGPIKLVFSVTPGSACAVENSDDGFGYGYDIAFRETAKVGTGQYTVAMYVPAQTGMKVQLVCDPVDPTAKATDKVGYANAWITVGTKF